VKIGDMGTAKMRFGKKYTVIGTPEFMAPEMYEEKGYNEKVDIYAFGMCLLEMSTGEYPYSECKNAAQIYKKVSQGVKPECLAKVHDKEILTVINSCLASENDRWSAKKLSEHAFLLEEPEVILVSAAENKTKLKLQVLFKGQEKHSIKFEYNRDMDTAEDVVKEMIEEKVLSAKYQGLVCNEIHRILREITKNSHNKEQHGMSSPMDIIRNEERSSHRRVPSEYETIASISLPLTRSRSQQRHGTFDNDADSLARGTLGEFVLTL
jgi:WNK lysine deficient protein kinase